MLVKIKNLTGHVFNLDVEPTDTVLHIKQLVEQKEGIPPEQQRIIFAAKQLFVFTPLSQCSQLCFMCFFTHLYVVFLDTGITVKTQRRLSRAM